jgi:TPR repeat protein
VLVLLVVFCVFAACAHPTPSGSASELYQRALLAGREESAGLFEKACASGEAKGCARRALLVECPTGPDVWRARAEPGLSKACEGADPDACELEAVLGPSPEAGQRALALYDERCGQRDAEACLRVGTLLQGGRVAPRDDDRSLARMLRACELDLAGGCFAAGLRFLRGEGVAANQARASELFRRAKQLSGPPDAGS